MNGTMWILCYSELVERRHQCPGRVLRRRSRPVVPIKATLPGMRKRHQVDHGDGYLPYRRLDARPFSLRFEVFP